MISATSSSPGVQKGFVPTENAAPDVAKTEAAFMEKLANRKIDTDDKGKLNNGMILGKLEDWIKLLIATVKNQDPSDPVDHKDMINQFSQFAQTMGMNEIKDLLSDFKNIMGTTQAIEAAQQLDRILKLEASEFGHNSNDKNPPKLGYEAPKDAKEVSIVITDSEHKVVQTLKVPCVPGENFFEWDRKTMENKVAPDGTYTFRVVAFDEKDQRINDHRGSPMAIKTFVTGLSHGAGIEKSGPFVKINNVRYPLSSLRSIDMSSLQEVHEDVKKAANQDDNATENNKPKRENEYQPQATPRENS